MRPPVGRVVASQRFMIPRDRPCPYFEMPVAAALLPAGLVVHIYCFRISSGRTEQRSAGEGLQSRLRPSSLSVARHYSLVCLILIPPTLLNLQLLIRRPHCSTIDLSSLFFRLLYLRSSSDGKCTLEPESCLLRQDALAQPIPTRKAQRRNTLRPLPYRQRTSPSSLGSKDGMHASKASQVSRLEASRECMRANGIRRPT
jgi:hypothetical protein